MTDSSPRLRSRLRMRIKKTPTVTEAAWMESRWLLVQTSFGSILLRGADNVDLLQPLGSSIENCGELTFICWLCMLWPRSTQFAILSFNERYYNFKHRDRTVFRDRSWRQNNNTYNCNRCISHIIHLNPYFGWPSSSSISRLLSLATLMIEGTLQRVWGKL